MWFGMGTDDSNIKALGVMCELGIINIEIEGTETFRRFGEVLRKITLPNRP